MADVSQETRRERRLAARAERERQANEGRKKAQRRRVVGRGAIAVVIVALLGLGAFFLFRSVSTTAPGRSVPDEGRTHVNQGSPLEYKSDPPASGTHYPTWIRSGIYAEPQETGNWVHSLEHGYIVILYNCPGDCPGLQEQLKQFYEAAPKSSRYGYQKLVIAPYPTLSHPLAALAWDHILDLDQFDAGQLSSFYQAYMDHGPEDAP